MKHSKYIQIHTIWKYVLENLIVCDGPITKDFISVQQYKIFCNNQHYINCDDPKNNCIFFENGQIMSILNFIKSNDNKMYAIGKVLVLVEDLYTQPISSLTLNIGIMSEDSRLQTWQFDKIRAKY